MVYKTVSILKTADFKRVNFVLCQLYPNKSSTKNRSSEKWLFQEVELVMNTSKNTDRETIALHVDDKNLDFR